MSRGTGAAGLIIPALVAAAGIVVIFALRIPAPAQPGSDDVGSSPVPAAVPYIDAHTHFDEKHPEATVQALLRDEGRENAAKIYLQIPPFSFTDKDRFDAEVILPYAKKYPDKIGVLGGGGRLNPMIMEAVSTGNAGSEVRKKFRETAEALLREGVAGFGEMAAEHFVGSTGYESAPPDHPLFLLLADIAAEHGVPIEIHMEVVPLEMPLPAPLKSPPNAATLHPNIVQFGRLLSHNPRAKILWAHLGVDGTGFRTPALCGQLLRAHPNLYMEIKHDPKSPGKNPVLVNGKVAPEWLALFRKFPNRILIGSDQHYSGNDDPGRWQSDVTILNQLPTEIRIKIASENARRVFSVH